MALCVKVAATSNYPSTSIHLPSFNKSFSVIKLGTFISLPSLKSTPYNLPLLSSSRRATKSGFRLHSAVESVTVEEEEEEEEEEGEVANSPNSNHRRKLFVLNLPWSFSVEDIKKLFGECGIVSDVEIIKQKGGKGRGFAFVTMASGEEALAAVEKFDSSEIVGRIIRVEFAKRFKKPVRAIPTSIPRGDPRYKLYISNLSWKVRSNNLRDFFSSDFNPVSARVVFDSPSGKSAGYGFVAFATKEEAESAISALNGKELLGRPITLKFSEKNADGKDKVSPIASESKEESKSDPSESIEESNSDASEVKEESNSDAPESREEVSEQQLEGS